MSLKTIGKLTNLMFYRSLVSDLLLSLYDVSLINLGFLMGYISDAIQNQYEFYHSILSIYRSVSIKVKVLAVVR